MTHTPDTRADQPEQLVVLTTKLAFALPAGADLSEVYDLTNLYDLANLMLIPLQRREGGDSGLIDYAFYGEPVVSPTPVAEAHNGFLVPDLDREVALNAAAHLRNQGYAVIIWSPDELGGINPRRIEDRLIELGHDVIDYQQAVADSGTSFVIETQMANGEWERVDCIESEDGSRSINTYPTRAAAQAELDDMLYEMDSQGMDVDSDDWRIVPE